MSGSHQGKSTGPANDDSSAGNESAPPMRKKRPGDIGRALRTVYDDTLRESVPDDFLDLLGKLT